ncbi:uncharacterized protein LOC119741727 [Patiria miniata]|uniref:Uncharacterized protein n=1 Tax=Patiria miniata TaxID=46514 RepID=A0A914BDL5_PATMI|nr:uncharacterized protein LOC119741727 [Patiria miniata]
MALKIVLNVNNCVICTNPVVFGVTLRDRVYRHDRQNRTSKRDDDTVAQILMDLFELEANDITCIMDQFVCSECNILLFYVHQLVPVWKEFSSLRKRLNKNGYIGVLRNKRKWLDFFESSKETQTPEWTPCKACHNVMTEDEGGCHNATSKVKASTSEVRVVTEHVTSKRNHVQKAERKASKRTKLNEHHKQSEQSTITDLTHRATQTPVWNNVAAQKDVEIKMPKAATKKKPFIKHSTSKAPQGVKLTLKRVSRKRTKGTVGDEATLVGWQHCYSKVRMPKRHNVACDTDDLPVQVEEVQCPTDKNQRFKDIVFDQIQRGCYGAAVDHAMDCNPCATKQIIAVIARRAGMQMKRFLQQESMQTSEVTRDDVMNFKWQDAMKEFKTHLPILYTILSCCVASPGDVTKLRITSKRVGKLVPGLGLVLSMVTTMRNQFKFKIIPMLIGMYLHTHGLSKNALESCASVGLCPTIKTVAPCLKEVLSEQQYPPNIMCMHTGACKDYMYRGAALL